MNPYPQLKGDTQLDIDKKEIENITKKLKDLRSSNKQPVKVSSKY